MGIKDGFAEIHKRETGEMGPTRFVRQFSVNESMVNRLGVYRELGGYEGPVVIVRFNAGGDLVATGCFGKVTVWNWETQTRRLSYDSGHRAPIMDTWIMPNTNDKRLVTACCNGQVRLGEILEDGQVVVKSLATNCQCVYRLAVKPDIPHILYSCSEDGLIRQFDLRSNSVMELLRCTPLLTKQKHIKERVEVYAMVFDPSDPNYFCIGADDVYARVYDIRNLQRDAPRNLDKPVDTFCPNHLIERNGVHITGLAYANSNSSELLVTYYNEHIYLFQKNMGLGPSPSSALSKDILKLEKPQVFLGNRNAWTPRAVNFFGPNDDYVLSGSDCGHIYIWKKKGGKLVRVMKGSARSRGLDHVEPHPHFPTLASSGSDRCVKLWGPMANDALPPPYPHNIEKIMKSNGVRRDEFLQTMANIYNR